MGTISCCSTGVWSLSHVWLFATPWTVAARLSCPSLSPGVCSNSYPLSQWGHPTISSSVTPFYSCPQSFPASGSFPVSQPPERKPQYGKLTKMITWITGLCNSVKLWAVLCRAIQDRQVMVESSDRTRSTGGGNGKPLQYSCLENHMNSTKRWKDMTLEGIQYATGEEWRKSFRKNEEAEPKWKQHRVWW